jgi:hypothetical protein
MALPSGGIMFRPTMSGARVYRLLALGTHMQRGENEYFILIRGANSK